MLLMIAGSCGEVVASVVVHLLMREGGTSGSVSWRFVFRDLLNLLDGFDDRIADHSRSKQRFVLRSRNVSIAGIMAGATRTGIVSMVMMMMVLVVPYFVPTVVQLVEVVLIRVFHIGVFNDVEVFPNVVTGLVLTSDRAVAMEIVISFAVVIVIVVAHVIVRLTVMIAMVASADVIIVDVVVLVGNLHLCLLL